MQRVGGFRRKTRHKLRKPLSLRGKISIPRYLQEFTQGDCVYLVAEPSVHAGMYFPRYHGKKGVVTGKRGVCYQVVIHDGSVKKQFFVHPVHLKKEHGSKN